MPAIRARSPRPCAPRSRRRALAQARRKSRKRSRRQPGEPPRRRLTSEEKNAAARAQLEPLEEGERPTAVTVAAIVALVLAVANAVFFLAGAEIDGRKRPPGALLFCAVMLAAAWGMWHGR